MKVCSSIIPLYLVFLLLLPTQDMKPYRNRSTHTIHQRENYLLLICFATLPNALSTLVSPQPATGSQVYLYMKNRSSDSSAHPAVLLPLLRGPTPALQHRGVTMEDKVWGPKHDLKRQYSVSGQYWCLRPEPWNAGEDMLCRLLIKEKKSSSMILCSKWASCMWIRKCKFLGSYYNQAWGREREVRNKYKQKI